MPRYLALIYGPESNIHGVGGIDPEAVAEYNEFGAAAGPAGLIDDANALQATSTAVTVSVLGGKGGEVVTVDGPFAETKVVLGGYYLLNCKDLDEALSWAARIPGAWRGGQIEVRPVLDFSAGYAPMAW